MASGSVIEYRGKRGKVFRIKYADASGKQVMETVGAERNGVDRKQAEAELRERVVRVEQKHYRRPEAFSFRKAAEGWRAETSIEKRWKPATAAQYRSIVERLNDYFGAMAVGAIRPRHVTAYKTEALERYSAASVSRDLSILHSILAWAVVHEHIDHNPAAGVRHPHAKQRKGVVLTPAQFQSLARSFDDEQDRVMFRALVLTGVRRAELLALRWRDVDLIENRLRVEDSKTETGIRSIAIPPSLAEELWQHRRATSFQGDDERAFARPQASDKAVYAHYRASLVRAFETAGLDWPESFRPCHDLRVTSATNDLLAGAPKESLQIKLGHANFSTTQRYVNLAGVVFADEAAALEQRMNGGAVESSTDLGEPESTSRHPAALSEAESHAAD
jgi:integrase